MGDPLWERLLIAATGPVVTAALALVVLNTVAGWAQRRRDAAETREALAAELMETANSLYLALQAFWRAARDAPLAERRDSPALSGHIEFLDDAYLLARSKGQVLEQRLKIYFAASEPSDLWHRVTDLLTVRYFLLLEGDADRRARIRRINSGPRSSQGCVTAASVEGLAIRSTSAGIGDDAVGGECSRGSEKVSLRIRSRRSFL